MQRVGSGLCDRRIKWQRGALCVAMLATALTLLGNSSAVADVCPNEELRSGPSALLPDCRAYELVTPDTAGRAPWIPKSHHLYDLFPTEMKSPTRESTIFMTRNASLPEFDGANGDFDLYESVRSPDGWQVARRMSPSGEQAIQPTLGGVDSEHHYLFTTLFDYGGG